MVRTITRTYVLAMWKEGIAMTVNISKHKNKL
jgi:hypothetical protein